MPVSLQVIYPDADDSSFDHDYYAQTHMALVKEHWGPFIDTALVTKGIAGAPGQPAPYHAIASITFADMDAMKAAMKAGGPVLADVPNFTNIQPQTLVGEVVG